MQLFGMGAGVYGLGVVSRGEGELWTGDLVLRREREEQVEEVWLPELLEVDDERERFLFAEREGVRPRCVLLVPDCLDFLAEDGDFAPDLVDLVRDVDRRCGLVGDFRDFLELRCL